MGFSFGNECLLPFNQLSNDSNKYKKEILDKTFNEYIEFRSNINQFINKLNLEVKVLYKGTLNPHKKKKIDAIFQYTKRQKIPVTDHKKMIGLKYHGDGMFILKLNINNVITSFYGYLNLKREVIIEKLNINQ